MSYSYNETKFDYSKLTGRIIEIFKTRRRFAEKMDWSLTTTYAKLNNKVEWSQTNILKSAELLGINAQEIPAFYFALDVQNS